MVVSCLLPVIICVWVYFQPDNLSRITAFAVIGIYISFQMVVLAALRQRLKGWKPAGSGPLAVGGNRECAGVSLRIVRDLVTGATGRQQRLH